MIFPDYPSKEEHEAHLDSQEKFQLIKMTDYYQTPMKLWECGYTEEC